MKDFQDITTADIDFRVYYEVVENEIEISSVYIYSSQVDLVGIISEEIKEDIIVGLNTDEG